MMHNLMQHRTKAFYVAEMHDDVPFRIVAGPFKALVDARKHAEQLPQEETYRVIGGDLYSVRPHKP